jgi:hypothetical protein
MIDDAGAGAMQRRTTTGGAGTSSNKNKMSGFAVLNVRPDMDGAETGTDEGLTNCACLGNHTRVSSSDIKGYRCDETCSFTDATFDVPSRMPKLTFPQKIVKVKPLI